MTVFVYLSWYPEGKLWHTPFTGQRIELADNLVEGSFVLFAEQYQGKERYALVGMTPKDVILNEAGYDAIESLA